MKIVYLSEGSMYVCSDGKVSQLPCERADKYADTVNEINKNKAWKHSGRGAEFMGAVEHYEDASKQTNIFGISSAYDGFVYSAVFGEMGAIYRKNADEPKAPEGHIYTGMNRRITDICFRDGKIAAIMDGHLAVFDERGDYDEITDGASAERYPFWSANDNRILCSTVGFSIGGDGGVSPSSIMAVDTDAGKMDELFAEENTDLIKPKNDSEGNYYFIRQPYKEPRPKKEPILKSILLFPVRLIKAIIGFLNAFTTIFGGEPLRKNQQKGDVKTKTKSNRELYFEGRLLEAEKNEKENAASGDKNPSILPRSRVLVKKAADGSETVIKKGVLDYALCDEGIVYSNGKEILLINGDGEESVIAKAAFADNINILK
ncbi:hypothetical protein [Ruminococcus flavefaciens]|uniref:Uncharacterized protein n=1 Tax=Ruminococcus flavefaciens TaxID=1265 RepID=A0A1M7LVR0_RUMFL|nr:hypothetical protein [Ruminococcus flavefaciens]SHM82318.1 hypothetical protein SAMN04487860_11625 [Ruminococcus flavefaciens]